MEALEVDTKKSLSIPPVNFRQSCRLCLGEERLEDLFNQGDLHRWISDYLSVVINQNDSASRCICAGCRTRLREFREFQQRCQEAQNQLLSRGSITLGTGDTVFTLEQVDSKNIKMEPGLSDSDFCRLCLSGEDIQDVFNQGDLHLLISKYLSIVISDTDSISRFCCTGCQIRLEEFREFQIRCIDVQTTLLDGRSSFLHNDDLIQANTVQKTEIESEEDTEDDSDHLTPPSSATQEDPDEESVVESVECKVCHKVLEGSKDLKTRLRKHMIMHGPKDFVCSVCNKAFVRNFHLKQHMKSHNKSEEDDEPTECPICHKICKSRKAMSAHKRIHGPKTHVCPICSKAFAIRQTLRDHLPTHNSKTFHDLQNHSEHPFKCETCHKIFKSRKSLLYHKSIHQPKKHVCSICGEAFVWNRELNDHMATHRTTEADQADHPFKCDVCFKTYKRSNSLQQHMKMHGPEKHVCTICNKAFAESRRLAQHIKTHNKVTAIVKIEYDENHSDLDAFQCEFCPKIYHFQRELMRHVRGVHKLKKHGCDSCTAAFETRDELELHLKSHDSKESTQDGKVAVKDQTQTDHNAALPVKRDSSKKHPFQCTVCRKVFKDKAKLVLHVKTVRANMTYECSICKKRFPTRAQLENHYKDAIHSEGNSKDSKKVNGLPMETDDLFEAEHVKVEVLSDDDE